jgi:hypothetical protein
MIMIDIVKTPKEASIVTITIPIKKMMIIFIFAARVAAILIVIITVVE